MANQEIFQNINTAMDMAGDNGDRVLGGLLILSGVITEFQLADLIDAEADKVSYAVGYAQSNSGDFIEQLAALDDSVANVLDKVCCIENQVNEKIKQGIMLRANNAPAR